EKLTSIMKDAPKIKPENIVMIGIRCLDEGEKELLRKLNVKVYTLHEIDRLGMSQVMQEAEENLQERTDDVHLNFDLDGIEQSEAPDVSKPINGGVTYGESHLALEMLAESGFITSAEYVEINPTLDEKSKTAKL